MWQSKALLLSTFLLLCGLVVPPTWAAMPWVQLGPTGSGFVLEGSVHTPFLLWGVNYDHDDSPGDPLIEDYWVTDWERVEQDFGEIKALGVNSVRIHLQTARFVGENGTVNQVNLGQLDKLIDLAERQELYLLLTGLGFYHSQATPEWMEALDEEQRWELQAFFWRTIATLCRNRPAVYAYDLMNEPVVPSQRNAGADKWTGVEYAGKHFTQRLALDARGRTTTEIAARWIEVMTASIRQVDEKHLLTLGVVAWPQGKPLFYSEQTGKGLDFVSIHLYPEAEKLAEADRSIEKYSLGKPLVVTEIFPLAAPPPVIATFMEKHSSVVSGWYSFYWGRTRQQYLKEVVSGGAPINSLMVQWLDIYQNLIGQTAASP